ncbi:MAG: DUF2092 domain-containing protein [Cyanobium sp.]
MEARALDLLRASSARLAASKSMAFTATVGYEYPSRLGPPLLYTVRYEVLMQRPNRLRVLIPGDGPASQFFFDGRTIMAFAPERNLVAIEPAPPHDRRGPAEGVPAFLPVFPVHGSADERSLPGAHRRRVPRLPDQALGGDRRRAH